MLLHESDQQGDRVSAAGLSSWAWASRRGTPWAIAVVLAVLFALLLGGAYLYARLLTFEEAKTLAHNDAIARGVAAAIEAREEGYANILLSYAGRFRFREAVKRKDRGEALIHLRQLAESFPELDRPFLADPAAVVWTVYHEVPAVYGRSFAQRDWYRGVSREWRPYKSQVFEVATAERPLVVTLVEP